MVFFVVMLIGNAIWLSLSPIDVDILSYGPAYAIIALGGVLYLIYKYKRPDYNIMTLLSAALFFLLATNILSITSYLMTSLPLPLRDAWFNGFDLWLGFNFNRVLLLTNGNEWAAKILPLFYHSSLFQMILIVLLLAALKPAKLIEFCRLYLIIICITFIIALLLPAMGPYDYLNVVPQSLANLGEHTGRLHIKTIEALRAGGDFTISFTSITGLVTFPSFHTALALLVPYALRDYKWLCILAIAVNVIVLIATVPIGGHYLTDILGGILLTVSVILATKKPDLNE
uniref:Inositolphosphotransferase Aur1/Ipt1 domain-containing protein n=1 Tax=OCS116 cluster bacterium TaxID=2030921 RepID=A0A2A4YSA3_9PROT